MNSHFDITWLSLTTKCNLTCKHCSKSTFKNIGYDTSKDLINYFNSHIAPISKIVKLGGNSIGEPMLAKNFDYFLQQTNHPNIHLVTNLSLLNQNNFNLINKKIKKIEVSIDGFEKTYEEIRGLSWESLKNKLQIVSKHEGKISIQICVTNTNIQSLPKIFELKKYNISEIIFNEYTPNNFLFKDKIIKQPKKDEILDLIKKTKIESQKTGIPSAFCFSNKYTQPTNTLKNCYRPWKNISIDPKGYISPCCKNIKLQQITNFNKPIEYYLQSKSYNNFKKKLNTDKPPIDCIHCERKTSNLEKKYHQKLLKNYSKQKIPFLISKGIRHFFR